jgi:hypothetical protein
MRVGETRNTFTNLIGNPETGRSLEVGNLGIDWRIILRNMSKLVVTAEFTRLPQEMVGCG